MASVGVWDLQYENTLASAAHRVTNRVRRGLGLPPSHTYYGSRSRQEEAAEEDVSSVSDMGPSGGAISGATGGRTSSRPRGSESSSVSASIDGGASPLFAPENMAELNSISFVAPAGKITGILSNDEYERRLVAQMIGQPPWLGEYSGRIMIRRDGSSSGSTSGTGSSDPFYNGRLRSGSATNIVETLGLNFISKAFASRRGLPPTIGYVPADAETLYIPGLTYLELLTYSARLRDASSGPSYQTMNGPTSTSSTSGTVAYESLKIKRTHRESEGFGEGSMFSLGSTPVGTPLEVRVKQVMELLDLESCENKFIPERPSLRGAEGGDIRRLSVALEMVSLPDVLVLEDPTLGLDPAEGLKVMSRLQPIADRGITVICSLPKPSPQVYSMLDHVVLLAEGRTLFASSTANVIPFFCDVMQYALPNSSQGSEGNDSSSKGGGEYNHAPVDVAEFLLDVASGTERPIGWRTSQEPHQIQWCFDHSKYGLEMTAKLEDWMSAADRIAMQADQPDDDSYKSGSISNRSINQASTSNVVDLLPTNKSSGWCAWLGGVFENYSFSSMVPSFQSLSISLERAITVKFREREVIVKSMFSTVFMGLFIGLLAYGTGDFGLYCISLSGMPYANSFNMVAILFLLVSVLFSMQILNIHIVCKKLEIFRFEQRKRCVSMLEFWFATLVTETATGLVYGLVYSNIVYFLVKLAAGWGKYVFFMELLSMTAMMAVAMAVTFAAVLRVEFLIRDAYLVWFFLMVMMSGYPIHIPYFFDWVQRLSILNPLKWAYEGSFVWKFENYVDGNTFLTTYGFDGFDKNTIFEVLPHYITFFITVFLIALSPRLNFLTRKAGKHEKHRMSTHSSENVVFIAPKHAHNGHHNIIGNRRKNPLHMQAAERAAAANQTDANESSGRDDKQLRRNMKLLRSPSSRGRVHVLPTVFHKNTSISSKGATDSVASSGVDIENAEPARGPTVTFDNLFYIIKAEGRVKESLSASWARIMSVWRGNSGARYKAGRGSSKRSSFGGGSFREVLPTIDFDDEDIVDLGIAAPVGATSTRNASRGGKFDAPLLSSKKTEADARNRDQSKRYVLRNASGQCDWGKLTFIMGHDDSGKSTLLHLLAGMHASSSTVVTSGCIAYDGIPLKGFNEPRKLVGQGGKQNGLNSDMNAGRPLVDAEISFGHGHSTGVGASDAAATTAADESAGLLFDRRKRTYRPGYVCGVDEHLDCLTVAETIAYAIRLRRGCHMGDAYTDDALAFDTDRILDSLHLHEVADTYAVDLSVGQRRMLSLAEELAEDPYLLLIDEPVRSLSARETAVVMACLRELVNQDRTVIATIYEASASAFSMFDNLILMSHGSVIYSGPADLATKFFIQNPSYDIVRSSAFDATLLVAPPSEPTVNVRVPNIGNPVASNAPATGAFPFGMSSAAPPFITAAAATAGSAKGDPMEYLLKLSAMKINHKERCPRRLGSSSKASSAGSHHSDDAVNAASVEDIDDAEVLFVGPHASALQETSWSVTFAVMWRQGKVLFQRSYYSLFRRWHLVLSAIALHICFALIFPITLGNSSNDEYAIMAFYGYGSMLLSIAGVQFGPFLINTMEVYLKERYRGVYSTGLQHWVFASFHFYWFRTALGIGFGALSYYLLDLRQSTEGFYILALTVHVICCAAINELILFGAPDLRAAYAALPSFTFLLFVFSNLMLKPSLYFDFLKPWVPGISVIRWTCQGMVVNEFSDNVNMPLFFNYSTFDHLMHLFGWGGKTKWECLYHAAIHMAVYRLLVLYVLEKRAYVERFVRHYLRAHPSEEVKLY